MKVYIDYILFINFLYDFIILLATNILLKRNTKLIKIILGSVFGSISIFLLFINMDKTLFMLIKLLFGLLMVIITFKYKTLKYTLNNFLYMMILSIVVGGFLYMINIEVGYEHIGIVFLKDSKGLNIFISLLLVLLAVIIYVKKIKKDQISLNNFYEIDLYIDEEIIKLNGFLDTGNNLIDPYFHKPVLILNKNIKINKKEFIFVPFKTLNNKGVLKCFLADKIYIKGIGFRTKVLIGISSDNFSLDGCDIILNSKIMKGK